MNDKTTQVKFWERVEVLRDPARTFKELVEAAGIRLDVAQVMRRRNTLPPVHQICALARELGISVEWLMSSETMETLEQAINLSDGQRARIRALALKIMSAPSEIVADVEKSLNLD